MLKRILLGFMALTLLVTAVGCSGPKPEATVQAFMDALIEGDYTTAGTYLTGSTEATDKVLSPEEEEGQRLVNALVSRIGYEMGEATVTDDTATVVLTVTAPNMLSITANVVGEMIGASFAMAFSEDPQAEAMLNEMWIAKFEEKIGAENAPVVTNEATVQLIKSEDGWLIQGDDAFADALTGNMISAFAENDIGE